MAPVVFGLVVGLSLGLTGGGGSIFAVPLLVYGLGFEFRPAVALSLGIVGAVAAFGAALHARRGEVAWRAGLTLGLGGLIVAPLGAYVGAKLGENISLALFALVMGIVGVSMFRGGAPDQAIPPGRLSGSRGAREIDSFARNSNIKLIAAGGIVGFLSGLFGVGGGFLIVPALLIVLPIEMKTALGTSLVSITIIAVSGLSAHIGDLKALAPLVPAAFFAGAAGGMIAGLRVKDHLDRRALRRSFGALTFVGAIVVITLTTLGAR